MAAGEHVPVPAGVRPVIDLPDQLTARCVLALAPEHVSLDQLRSAATGFVTQLACAARQATRRREGRLGGGEWDQFHQIELGSKALMLEPGKPRDRRRRVA